LPELVFQSLGGGFHQLQAGRRAMKNVKPAIDRQEITHGCGNRFPSRATAR
jgi:hypothetical protein